MSIYIQGIQIPETMSVLAVFPNGYVAVYDNKDTFIGEAKAVPVPAHGRLGDLDALTDVIEHVDWYHQNEEKDMVHGANSSEHQAWYKEQDIYRAIESAPTIIPADPEGGADNG